MPRLLRTTLAAAALVVTASASAAAADATTHMTYDVYVGGLRMLEVESGLTLAAIGRASCRERVYGLV